MPAPSFSAPPLDTATEVGAQASREQFDKILGYMEIGRSEGAKMLVGGSPAKVSGLEGGFYIQPTIFSGQNKMWVFQEEIFGPALGVTTFKDEADALAIANDNQYGLVASLWTRDSNLAWSGSTATTPTRHAPPLAVTKSRG